MTSIWCTWSDWLVHALKRKYDCDGNEWTAPRSCLCDVYQYYSSNRQFPLLAPTSSRILNTICLDPRCSPWSALAAFAMRQPPPWRTYDVFWVSK
jgi:hypothetical protein